MSADRILDTPARPVAGQQGTTDTALIVRLRSGETVPVGVQTGRKAREYLAAYSHDGSLVIGVRRDGVTYDLMSEPEDLLRAAYHKLHEDAVLRYQAEVTARVMKKLRTDPKTLRPCLEDDRLIAAVALVVAQLNLPGQESSELG